jgi:hypothetical protein
MEETRHNNTKQTTHDLFPNILSCNEKKTSFSKINNEERENKLETANFMYPKPEDSPQNYYSKPGNEKITPQPNNRYNYNSQNVNKMNTYNINQDNFHLQNLNPQYDYEGHPEATFQPNEMYNNLYPHQEMNNIHINLNYHQYPPLYNNGGNRPQKNYNNQKMVNNQYVNHNIGYPPENHQRGYLQNQPQQFPQKMNNQVIQNDSPYHFSVQGGQFNNQILNKYPNQHQQQDSYSPSNHEKDLRFEENFNHQSQNHKGGHKPIKRGNKNIENSQHQRNANGSMKQQSQGYPINRNSRYSKQNLNYLEMDYDELSKNCYMLAKDQGGCRFMQKKMEENPSWASDSLYPLIRDSFIELTLDAFGNYFIQKLIEFVNEQVLMEIFDMVTIILLKIDFSSLSFPWFKLPWN